MPQPPRGMTIATMQARQVEIGRIRMGTSTPKTSKAGKDYREPVKLDRFLFTSPNRRLVEQIAEMYGGEVIDWQGQGRGPVEAGVVVEQTEIDVLIPPSALSSAYEQWTSGKCTRRCDGIREWLSDQSCICGPDPDNRECKPYTRLSLMVARLSGTGVWRLETKGYGAAEELPAVVAISDALGGYQPAMLSMRQASKSVPNPKKPGEMVMVSWQIPVLTLSRTPAELAAAMAATPALEAGVARQALAVGPAPADAPPDEPDPARTTRADELRDEIARATTRDRMMQIKAEFEQLGLEATLRPIWQQRAQDLVAGSPSQQRQPPTPAPPAPATEAALPLPDDSDTRAALWQQILAWGGHQSPALTTSQISGRFEIVYGHPRFDATGGELAQFLEDAKAGKLNVR